MTVVTGSNLHSESWKTLQAVISGNVVDPILSTRTSDKLQFIFGAFPDVDKTRPNFPILVIENPKTDRANSTFGYGNVDNSVNVSVWAYSRSNQQLNELTDDIQDAILQSRKVMMGSNLKLISLNEGAAGTDIVANTRVHFKETQAQLAMVSQSA